jgi:ribulose-bisphosphate carboxylase large chain
VHKKACADPPAAPFARWVEGIMAEIERTADRTGRKLIYAFNITDEINSGL